MNGFDPEYIRAAIQNEATRVALAAASTRNDTLNKAAFNLASLGVPGSEIIHSLRTAALQCGLKNGEIYSTINSGMRAGRQHPRSTPANGRGRVAADRLGVIRKREGFGPGAAYHWSLPAPCVPGTMLAHACPISKEGTHGTHDEAQEGRDGL
jgi:hypothetical protein